MSDADTEPNTPLRASLADVSGVIGAIVAALCCAGTPIIVSALAAVGLSALRRDAVLWPIMLLSLIAAIWGFLQGRRIHGVSGPLAVGVFGAGLLSSGVIVVHGPIAMPMIYGGAILLVLATIWNVVARRRCVPLASPPRSRPPAA